MWIGLGACLANQTAEIQRLQRRPTYKVSFWGGRVPLDLRFRGPLEAKSFVRGPKIDPPGAPGRVFDLKCRSCGPVRRCFSEGRRSGFLAKCFLEACGTKAKKPHLFKNKDVFLALPPKAMGVRFTDAGAVGSDAAQQGPKRRGRPYKLEAPPCLTGDNTGKFLSTAQRSLISCF